MLDFPANGAWWVGFGVGLILLLIISWFINYQFSLMPYKSNMGRTKKPQPDGKKSKELEDTTPKSATTSSIAATPATPSNNDQAVNTSTTTVTVDTTPQQLPLFVNQTNTGASTATEGSLVLDEQRLHDNIHTSSHANNEEHIPLSPVSH